MAATFSQYKSLLKVLIKNNLSFSKLSKNPKKSRRVASAIGVGVIVVIMLAYGGIMAASMALTASKSGVFAELLYMVIFMAQFIVLFFGGFAVMSNLYYSKDNTLLAALPINNKALFLAKFTMAYLAELFFSAIVIVPFMTAIGIVSFVVGLGLPWYFFVLELVLIFLVPILPLLLVTLLSLPIMYIMTFVKRSSIASGIIMTIIYVGVMAVYFYMMSMFMNFGGASEDGSSEIIKLPATTIQMFIAIKNITIFNYPMVEAMMGRNVGLNLLYYVGGLAALGAGVVVLSAFFYRKAMVTVAESNAVKASKKVNNELAMQSQSVTKAFFIKEFRTLIHTPMLLMNSLMGVVMLPLLMWFMSFTFRSAGSSEGGNALPPMFAVGMITYIAYILICATNQIALIGFSREGKHLLVLKTLPISASMMVKTKLFFATSITVILTLIASVIFPLVTRIYNVVAIIGFPLVMLLGGFGMNCIGLYGDLKKPNLRWNNISELTKNNKRQMKPALLGVGVGMVYVILGSVLAFQDKITGTYAYLLFFGVALIPSIILTIIGYTKLFDNPESLLDKIEG